MGAKFLLYAVLVTTVTTGTSWIKMIRSSTSNNQGNAWSQRTGSGGGYYGGGYSGGGGGGHK